MITEGTVIAAKYAVEAELAAGGMGAVFRARHLELGKNFAIKVLHPALVENPTILTRFRREAELAGRLRHENLVSVVDVGVTPDNEHYLVMEYTPGTSLAELLENGPMPEARVLEIGRQLCEGLQHAHDAGLIHRDFKPDNVMVERLEDGRELARIVDFGVAILREHASDVDNHRLTTKGVVVGTPRYMAPEQARGGAVDHRADLFSLGLMLYELLAGKPPFDGDGVEVARANVHLPTPVIGVRAPGVRVEPVLEALVYKLLSKNPDDRLQSARDVREMIALYVRDRAAAATKLGIRPTTLLSTGIPAIQPLAAGRGRSANISVAPYEHLVEKSPPAPQASEPDQPPRRRRLAFAIACVAGAAVIAAAIYLVQRPAHAPHAAEVVTREPESPVEEKKTAPEPPPPPSPTEEAPAPAPHDVATNGRRKTAKLPVPQAAPKQQSPNGAVPAAPSSAGSGSGHALTANEIAALYQQVGRELAKLSKTNPELASELWPRYRWIRISDALMNPVKRAEAARLLQGVLVSSRGQGSAAN